jgi:hypothetical protein
MHHQSLLHSPRFPVRSTSPKKVEHHLASLHVGQFLSSSSMVTRTKQSHISVGIIHAVTVQLLRYRSGLMTGQREMDVLLRKIGQRRFVGQERKRSRSMTGTVTGWRGWYSIIILVICSMLGQAQLVIVMGIGLLALMRPHLSWNSLQGTVFLDGLLYPR